MEKQYQTLGLENDAPFCEVKIAYRNLSMRYHPDINGNTDENINKFYEITEAYNEIKKDLKRIFSLLSIEEGASVEDVEVEYKKQVEELEFRAKMSNKGAKTELENLKKAFYVYVAEFKKTTSNW